MNKAQQEGYNAYHAGIPQRKNPYNHKRIQDKADWDNGWVYASLEEQTDS